jgi:hypothetical protein
MHDRSLGMMGVLVGSWLAAYFDVTNVPCTLPNMHYWCCSAFKKQRIKQRLT